MRKILDVHRKACTQEQDFGGRSSVTTLHAPLNPGRSAPLGLKSFLKIQGFEGGEGLPDGLDLKKNW